MHTDFPKITVLMPVYNGEKYLQEAINSILSQTFSNFEFLIIDDGSTDHSYKIINAYKDKRIRVIQNKFNIGLEKTLNRGILLAKGEYIARMDCDDISLPTRLQKQIDYMDANPHVTVCGTHAEIFGSKANIWTPPVSHHQIKCCLLFNSALIHPSVIMRKKEIINNHLMYDESQKFERAEDYELWVRISKNHKLANIGEILLRHRIQASSVGRVYTQEQVYSAEQIRKMQLEKLNLYISKKSLKQHSQISQGKHTVDPTYLNDTQNWLTKIAHANSIKFIYNEQELNTELASHWWIICSKSSALGLFAYISFWKSPLSRHIQLNLRQKILFFIKCWIKYEKK